MPRRTAPLKRSARRRKTLARGLQAAAVSLALGASCGPARADATQYLYRAVHADDIGAVKASLVAGANPTVRDRDGLTPAMLADQLGHRAIARYLRDATPANEESTRSEAASERGFLDRLLARVTTRRQAESAKVSIQIAAAPDEVRVERTAPDEVNTQASAPAEMQETEPPGALDKTDTAVTESPSPSESKVETKAKANGAPRFAFPLPPHKPAVAISETVVATLDNPFDPTAAPVGSDLAVVDKAPAPSSMAAVAETNPLPMERQAAAPFTKAEADANEAPPVPVPPASPVAPAAATSFSPSDFKKPNAFDRFLSSLFGVGGTQETAAAPDKARIEKSTPDKEHAKKSAPAAPEAAQGHTAPEPTWATADAQSASRDEPNAIDRFLRRLFSTDGNDAASVPAQAETPPPLPKPAVQTAAVAPPSVKDGPNGIDLFLRRLFTSTHDPAIAAEPPTTEIADAPLPKPVATAAPDPAPAVTAAADESIDPVSRALRNLFRGMAEKNVHADAARADDPAPARPIEVAEASGTIVSDRPTAESQPTLSAILKPVPAAPLTFAVTQPAVRRAPGANARAMSDAPPEAVAPTVVAENVLKPLIAEPPAAVDLANPAAELLAARPEPARAVPPKPAPFKPIRHSPLSDVPLALGKTATIGRPWPAENLPAHSCMIKKAWNAGFCVEPVDWPAAAAPIFDVSAPLYRGTMAVTRYEDGVARQYHTVFPAAMFGAAVGYFEDTLGPATEEDMKTVAMPGQPALRNPIRRWISVDSQTGRKTVIEVRGFDDLRNFIPDAEYGVTRLYEEGSGPVFEFLGTAELLLMRIRQSSAAFPTLPKTAPATR